MLKLTKKHTFYEVWCEWTAESVYIDHKPTKAEVECIVKKEWGLALEDSRLLSISEFIRTCIKVEKERHVYTTTAKAKRVKYHAERGKQ